MVQVSRPTPGVTSRSHHCRFREWKATCPTAPQGRRSPPRPHPEASPELPLPVAQPRPERRARGPRDPASPGGGSSNTLLFPRLPGAERRSAGKFSFGSNSTRFRGAIGLCMSVPARTLALHPRGHRSSLRLVSATPAPRTSPRPHFRCASLVRSRSRAPSTPAPNPPAPAATRRAPALRPRGISDLETRASRMTSCFGCAPVRDSCPAEVTQRRRWSAGHGYSPQPSSRPKPPTSRLSIHRTERSSADLHK